MLSSSSFHLRLLQRSVGAASGVRYRAVCRRSLRSVEAFGALCGDTGYDEGDGPS